MAKMTADQLIEAFKELTPIRMPSPWPRLASWRLTCFAASLVRLIAISAVLLVAVVLDSGFDRVFG